MRVHVYCIYLCGVYVASSAHARMHTHTHLHSVNVCVCVCVCVSMYVLYKDRLVMDASIKSKTFTLKICPSSSRSQKPSPVTGCTSGTYRWFLKGTPLDCQRFIWYLYSSWAKIDRSFSTLDSSFPTPV